MAVGCSVDFILLQNFTHKVGCLPRTTDSERRNFLTNELYVEGIIRTEHRAEYVVSVVIAGAEYFLLFFSFVVRKNIFLLRLTTRDVRKRNSRRAA